MANAGRFVSTSWYWQLGTLRVWLHSFFPAEHWARRCTQGSISSYGASGIRLCYIITDKTPKHVLISLGGYECNAPHVTMLCILSSCSFPGSHSVREAGRRAAKSTVRPFPHFTCHRGSRVSEVQRRRNVRERNTSGAATKTQNIFIYIYASREGETSRLTELNTRTAPLNAERLQGSPAASQRRKKQTKPSTQTSPLRLRRRSVTSGRREQGMGLSAARPSTSRLFRWSKTFVRTILVFCSTQRPRRASPRPPVRPHPDEEVLKLSSSCIDLCISPSAFITFWTKQQRRRRRSGGTPALCASSWRARCPSPRAGTRSSPTSCRRC